jgi:multicomponent Na+:H+ antiporter subunit E
LLRSLGLFVVLAILWWLLSGFFEPLLLGFGLFSCALVVLIGWRMDVIDHEGHPVELGLRALTYFPWLTLEIIKSNIDVAKRICRAEPDISPQLFRTPASQASELGQVIYANSITLTPGTISLQIEGRRVLVHSLSRDGREGVESGEMDRRVTAMTGGGAKS